MIGQLVSIFVKMYEFDWSILLLLLVTYPPIISLYFLSFLPFISKKWILSNFI